MTGRLLADGEIKKAIEDGLLEISDIDENNLDLKSPDCSIQPSSVDLTVGQIFDPPRELYELKNSDRWPQPLMALRLLPGHSAIVETQQTLKLSNRISAFGFPPAHLARKALLMTNPGHVDPGYHGKLTFTVINLGRDTIYLDRKDIIVTLLFFRFDDDGASFGYTDRLDDHRKFTEDARRRSRSKLLNTLSPDFGDFSQRMKIAADRAVNANLAREEMKKYWVSAATVALAAIVSAGIASFKDTRTMDELHNFNSKNLASLDELRNRLTKIEAETNNQVAIQKLEVEMEELRTALKDASAVPNELR